MRGSLRALYFCSHAKASYAIIAALVRCSRYQPVKAGYVAQIDRAMSVYSRNKKALQSFLQGGRGLIWHEQKSPHKGGLNLFAIHMNVFSIRVVLAAL